MGLACGHSHYGIIFVGADADGTLIAHDLIDGAVKWELYQSADGGLSWQHTATHHRWRDDGASEVITPGERYQIVRDGREIIRLSDVKSETVYSLDKLLDGPNSVLKRKARRSDGNKLHSIHYDYLSGNIIAAMETEGVIVGMPDGQ